MAIIRKMWLQFVGVYKLDQSNIELLFVSLSSVYHWITYLLTIA